MDVKSLRTTLLSLADALNAAKSRASTDIQNLESVFIEEPGASALASVDKISLLLKENKQSRIDQYLLSLQDSGTDKDLFLKVFEALDRDKLIDIEDTVFIARNYIGIAKKWRTKRAVLRSIREKFNERAYLESKMELLQSKKSASVK